MSYQSEAALEQQFIEQLNKQGYNPVSIPDYDALLENFKIQFAAFNAAKLDHPLTDKEWERVFNIMLGKSVFQSAKILRDKFVLEREDGTKVYLSFFDADHTKNIFQVTNQTTVVGKYVNRYDVTILVNGLPLIQVELKRRGIDIREAVNQVMRYKKHSYNGLYHFIQLFVVSNGVDGDFVYNPRKSNTAPYGPFNRYEREERGIISPLYTCLVLQADIEPSYLAWYFKSDAWYRYIYDNGSQGVRHDRVSMTDDLLMGIPVIIPSKEAQLKIANLLDCLESRFQTELSQYESLKSIRVALLQQLFI